MRPIALPISHPCSGTPNPQQRKKKRKRKLAEYHDTFPEPINRTLALADKITAAFGFPVIVAAYLHNPRPSAERLSAPASTVHRPSCINVAKYIVSINLFMSLCSAVHRFYCSDVIPVTYFTARCMTARETPLPGKREFAL